MSELTTNLHLELQKTSKMFSRWADVQIDKLETADANFNRLMEESKCTLDALKQNELYLETIRDQHNSLKLRQQDEIAYYHQEMEKINQQISILKPQLQKLDDEEKLAAIQRINVENEKRILLQLKERKYNDLTRGISFYKYLGLEFQKAEGDCMKFIFTQIDSSNHSRVFYFTIYVDNNDQYQFVNSNPPLDLSYCQSCIQLLNENNNISRFVINMRNAFKSGVARSQF
jgi:hypothetical protein